MREKRTSLVTLLVAGGVLAPCIAWYMAGSRAADEQAERLREAPLQMAILEPTMAETVGICLTMALSEALEEAVRRGVPRAAAEDFMYGHVKVELGLAFSRVNFQFSDGAKLISEFGRRHLLKPDQAYACP